MITTHWTNVKPELRKILPDSSTKNKLSTIGKLFLAIILIVVFEGALRKWVSSDFTTPLVLLRDGLALYGIHWSFKYGRMQASQFETQTILLWTIIVLFWGFIQLIVNQSSLLVFVVGVRFWLLYLWFAYATAISLNKYDFEYISKTILWLLVLMVPLAIVQFYLPPSAFLNQQVDGDESTVFRVTADIVRTTGTFSFTLGYSIFLAFASPFALAPLTPNVKLWSNHWIPKVMLLALATATMVSGSRGALIMFGLLFTVYILITLIYAKGEKKGGTIFMLISVVLLVAMVPYVLSRAVDATSERFETAAESEDFSARVLTTFIGEPFLYENIPVVGYGVGAGNNFAGVIATGERTFLLAETEAARTILEGGLVGFAFIGLKLLLISFGLRRSIQIVRLSGNSFPLLLWITLAVGLLTWSIIGQLTVNALGYLLLGLGLASLKPSIRQI